jgi:hypothetical protein
MTSNAQSRLSIHLNLLVLILAVNLVAAVVLVSPGSAESPFPPIALTDPESHRFTFTGHYNYRESLYNSSVLIEIVGEKHISNISGPESLLIEQLSSMKALNVERWLSTWDDLAQDQIKATLDSSPTALDELKNKWAKHYASMKEIRLRRWIETGTFVIVTYSVLQGSDPAKEFATVVKMEAGEWRATRDLETDPVVQYIDRNEQRIEAVAW